MTSENEENVLTRLKYLKEGTVIQLGNLIRRPNEGIRQTLRNLEQKGFVEKTGIGVWRLTQAGKNELDN